MFCIFFFQQITLIKRLVVAFVLEIQQHAGVQLVEMGGRYVLTSFPPLPLR